MYSSPGDEAYAESGTVERGEQLTLAVFPDVSLGADEILG